MLLSAIILQQQRYSLDILLPFHDALQHALHGVIAGLEPKTTLDEFAECLTSVTSLGLFLFLTSPVVLLAFQGTYFECFVLPSPSMPELCHSGMKIR